MRRIITNNELWQIEEDLDKLAKNLPGVYLLLETRIKQFREKNKMSLHILHKKFHEIQKKFIQHDDKNAPMRQLEAEGELKPWLYLESVVVDNGKALIGEEVAKVYLEEANDFLNRSIDVEV